MNGEVKPFVSIVVPVFNTAGYVGRCLGSLAAQDYGNVEIIVVDDGSTDESGAICDEYAERFSCIKVVHQQNAGVSAARNRALSLVCGTFVWFCDSDDWAEPHAVSVLVKAACSSKADLVVFALSEEDVRGRQIGLIAANPDPALVAQGPLQCDNQLYPQAHFARADLLRGMSFSEDLSLLEDREFFYAACLRSTHTVVIEDVLYHYTANRADSAVNARFSQRNVDSNRVEYEIFLSELERGYVMPAYQLFAAHSLGMLGSICKSRRCQDSFDGIRTRLLRFDEYAGQLTGFTRVKYALFARHLGLAKVIWRVWGVLDGLLRKRSAA